MFPKPARYVRGKQGERGRGDGLLRRERARAVEGREGSALCNRQGAGISRRRSYPLPSPEKMKTGGLRTIGALAYKNSHISMFRYMAVLSISIWLLAAVFQ